MKIRNKTTGRAFGFDPKKMKRLPRGSFLAKRGESQAKNTKVRISILVDLDVLNFFKERAAQARSEEHTSELQSQSNLVCRLLLETKRIQPPTSYNLPP